MKTTNRGYSEVAGDFHLLANFIVANNDPLRTSTTWSLGRFVDWKYGLYENKLAIAGFCDTNAQLWFDSFGELAGFAISENGGADFAIIMAQGYRFLFEEILQWILNHWACRGGNFSTELTEYQTMERALLKHYEFQHESVCCTRRFDLSRNLMPRLPLEQGFMIVDMQSHPDYRAQRLLRAEAFGGQSSLSEQELQRQLEFYNYAHTGPIYHAAGDLCVMAADGRFVSGCEALIDARNAQAEIERVCTHSQFRKRGFARALILECLYRLRDMGMHNAYITGYSPEAISVYGSLDATSEIQSFIYTRAAS